MHTCSLLYPVIMYSENHAASVEKGTHIIYTLKKIMCTFMPFSKSNNLIHTAHNGTE